MATKPNIATAGYFGIPLSIKRGNPQPFDLSEIFDTLAEAQAYATSDPVSYVGQVLTVLNTDTADNVPKVYVIKNIAGDLEPVGDASSVFSDKTFTDLVDRVDVIDKGDDLTEGSLAYVYDESKITIQLDPSATSGTNYDVYQGYTITDVPDGTNPDGSIKYKKVKTPNKIGTIGISADVLISGGAVVDITVDPLDPSKKIDSEGDEVSPTLADGKYLKLKLSDGTAIYVATSDLAKGLTSGVKLASNPTTPITPGSDGIIDLTGLSTDDLTPGSVDTWILSGGNATL